MIKKQKKQISALKGVKRLITIFALLIINCSLFLVSCDLFSGPADPELLDKLNEELAWANAEKLNVTVVTRGMGFSPQSVSAGDTRKGYAFNVEFTPNAGYGFRGWLAFTNSVYENISSSLNDMSFETARDTHSLNGKGVVVKDYERTHTGSYLSSVTINVSGAITIVPWCSTLPALSQATNPPLIPIQRSFPKNQTVRLVFTMDIDPATVILGKSIMIRGEYIDGEKIGTKPGDEGDITDYFSIEFPGADRVNLIPLADDPDFDWAFLSITVFAGPDIKNSAGLSMSSQEFITYQTDAGEARKSYTTGYITASRGDTDEFGVIFFQDNGTVWNNPAIDRRFNTTDKNTVKLRFHVFQPDEVTAIPNRFYIIEQLYASLGGSADSVSTAAFLVPPEKVTRDGTTYQIEYDLRLEQSGIIRLIVLPSYVDSVNADNNILPLDTSDAVAIGQFVTVAMDLEAPALADSGAVITGHSSASTLTDHSAVHIFGTNPVLNLTLNNLHLLRDNDNGDQGGISAAESFNRPWTMDDRQHLQWQVIARGTEGSNTYIRQSLWLTVQNNIFSADIKSNANNFRLENGVIYTLTVLFRDRMGNVSSPVEIGKIQSIEGVAAAATGLKGVCNNSGNFITVSFIPPADYNSLELVVRRYTTSADGDIYEKEDRYILSSTDNITGNTHSNNQFQEFTENTVSKLRYSFTAPQIIFNDVRQGAGISSVYGHEVYIITHAIVGQAVTDHVWVYNIPGMDADATNTVRVVNSEQLTGNNEELTKANIVLTRNIALENHIPIGTSDAPFTSKFYGNGHTITINSITVDDNTGLFGIAGSTDPEDDTTLIRDLTLEYKTAEEHSETGFAVTINPSGTFRFGGVVATAQGDTQFINVSVKGSVIIDESDAAVTVGGITGFMSNAAAIINSFSGIDITCTTTAIGEVFFGGVIGDTATGGIASHRAIDGVTVTGNLNKIHASSNSRTCAGGAAGRTRANVTFRDMDFTGNLTVTKGADQSSGYSYIGGITGHVLSGNYSECIVTGSISIPSTLATGEFVVGGIWGIYQWNVDVAVTDCWARVDITFEGRYARIGGVVGQLSNNSSRVLSMANCRYEGGTIKVTGLTVGGSVNDYKLVGGFAGGINRNTLLYNCYAINGSISVVNNGLLRTGGFSGTIDSTILANCYSSMDVYAEGAYVLNAGGFAGYMQPGLSNSTTLSNSYATGDVTAISTGNTVSTQSWYEPFSVGGFIGGILDAENTISNCYALGAVTAEKRNGTGDVNAGGITGSLRGSTIRNCFFGGTVTATRNNTGIINAGGIAGAIVNQVVEGTINSTISNNAAIGVSVTAKGGSTRNAGRIWGSAESGTSTGSAGSGNYALSTMVIEEDANHININPAIRTAVNNLTARDGTSTSASTFRTLTIWTTMGFSSHRNIYRCPANTAYSNTHTCVLCPLTWDFSRISRGYPTLTGLTGQ
ncbi:MAG: hypothetical protein FWD13_08565 [Treponema sp.]|nr:hypothetical protein [Treponema sp.]